MSSRKTHKRRIGGRHRQAILNKRLQYRELQRYYREVGEQLGDMLTPEQRREVIATKTMGASMMSDEVVDKLQVMVGLKQAIRELAAELGINHLAEDADPEVTLKLIGEALGDSGHRTRH